MGSIGSSSNHLEFEKLPLRKGEKLHRYRVRNHDLYEFIGEIHWRGGWRQYVFQALPNIDMSRGCHRQIDSFIDSLMTKWKKNLMKVQRCKYCGCTDDHACPGGCYWVKPNVCSRCAGKEKKRKPISFLGEVPPLRKK